MIECSHCNGNKLKVRKGKLEMCPVCHGRGVLGCGIDPTEEKLRITKKARVHKLIKELTKIINEL